MPLDVVVANSYGAVLALLACPVNIALILVFGGFFGGFFGGIFDDRILTLKFSRKLRCNNLYLYTYFWQMHQVSARQILSQTKSPSKLNIDITLLMLITNLVSHC